MVERGVSLLEVDTIKWNLCHVFFLLDLWHSMTIGSVVGDIGLLTGCGSM